MHQLTTHWKPGVGPPASAQALFIVLHQPSSRTQPLWEFTKVKPLAWVFWWAAQILLKMCTDSIVDNLNLHRYFWSLLSLLRDTTGFPVTAPPCSLHPLEHILQLLAPVCKLSPYLFHSITPFFKGHCHTNLWKNGMLLYQLVVYAFLHLFPRPWESQRHTVINAAEPLQKAGIKRVGGGRQHFHPFSSQQVRRRTASRLTGRQRN